MFEYRIKTMPKCHGFSINWKKQTKKQKQTKILKNSLVKSNNYFVARAIMPYMLQLHLEPDRFLLGHLCHTLTPPDHTIFISQAEFESQPVWHCSYPSLEPSESCSIHMYGWAGLSASVFPLWSAV